MKFREFITSSRKRVLVGKNAEQNEELVKQFIDKDNKIFHTERPGSPFCVIEDLKPLAKDIRETATFCALKSQDWRDNQQEVIVHVFTGKEVYKEKRMKAGMFGVRKTKNIRIKKSEIMKFDSKKV